MTIIDVFSLQIITTLSFRENLQQKTGLIDAPNALFSLLVNGLALLCLTTLPGIKISCFVCFLFLRINTLSVI